MKNTVYIANEIFDDLKRSDIKTSKHRAFAYSYVLLATFMYRYCLYVDDDGEFMTQGRLKEFLGYSAINKKVNYIIKENGVLDTLGYTKTISDFPVQYHLDEDKDVFFTMHHEVKEDLPYLISNERNFKIKMPVKSFYRFDSNGDLNGTYFDIENSHEVNLDVFKTIVNDKSLGVLGYYIYGYLKNRSSDEGYQISYELLSEELDINRKTLFRYIKRLEEEGFIRVEQGDFDNGGMREANTYYAN